MLYNDVRPHTFDEIEGQDDIVKALRSQSMTNQFFNLYILNGQYGGGKTTTARVIALAANCEHKDAQGNPCLKCEHCKAILSKNCSDYLELDAASNTGVDKARALIDDVGYMPTSLKKKVYIIDEAHMMSKGAFNSLLKTLEEPPEYAIFILCTTDIDAIPLTIRSRAAVCTFRKISESIIVKKLKSVSAEKFSNIPVQEEALEVIGANSDGSMRNALSLLEQIVAYGQVTAENAMKMIGVANTDDILNFVKSLVTGDVIVCVSEAKKIIAGGRQMISLTEDILKVLQDMLVLKVSESVNLISGTERYKKKVLSIAALSNSGQVCDLVREFMEIRKEVRKNPVETVFTCSIIRICAAERNTDKHLLISRLESLEKEVSLLKKGQVPWTVKEVAENRVEVSETESVIECSEDFIEQAQEMETPAEESHAPNLLEETLKADMQEIEAVSSTSEKNETVQEFVDEKEETSEEYVETVEQEDVSADFSNDDVMRMFGMLGMPNNCVMADTHTDAAINNLGAEECTEKKEPEDIHTQEEGTKAEDTIEDCEEEQADMAAASLTESCEETFDVGLNEATEDERSVDEEDDYKCPHTGFSAVRMPIDIDYDGTEEMDGYEAPEEDSEENIPDVVKQTLHRIEAIAKDEPGFCSAIEEGCKRKIEGDKLIFISPLQPVCNLIRKYFDVFDITAEVLYDSSQEI